MQFSDTTNKLGLIQECERLTNLGDAAISGNAALLKEFTANINEAGRKAWFLIHDSTGGWTYDDSNQTDLPQASADFASGTAKYALPSGSLTVERVEVKDANGTWARIAPIAAEGVADSLSEQGTGVPTSYRLVGDTLEFFPTPNYTTASGGFKVFYDRASVDFASTDTTKTPGFASIFHKYLAVDAALEWTKAKKPDSGNVRLLAADKGRYENDIREFYAKRWKDLSPRVRTQNYNWR